MMRAVLAAVLAATAGATGADDPARKADEAPKYASKGGRYKVRFPDAAKPKVSKQDLPGGLVLNVAAVEAGEKAYVVMYSDVPAGVDKADPKGVLDGAEKGAVANSGGKLVGKAKDFEFGKEKEKRKAREVVIEKDGATLKTWIVLAPGRMYVLVVGGPKEFGTSDAAADFLKSFELTD